MRADGRTAVQLFKSWRERRKKRDLSKDNESSALEVKSRGWVGRAGRKMHQRIKVSEWGRGRHRAASGPKGACGGCGMR